jgi:hypothetical protein
MRSVVSILALSLILPALNGSAALAAGPDWLAEAIPELEAELVAKYGESQRERIERGVRQVADFWRSEDGDRAVLESFVTANFAGDQETLDVMFARFEKLLEQLNGHMLEIILAFREQSDLDLGPIMPFDRVFAAYNPAAHVDDDFFANKLAFTVLLNFPVTTLEERLTEGGNWSRREWAEARLGNSFSTRIPASVQQEVSTAGAIADEYIAEYNIWMHHLLDDDGERLFPAEMKLLTHWNLRDQIKADYSDPQGLPKQRMIQKVMERIVDQTIPEMVVNNPLVDWNPSTNEVWPAAVQDSDVTVPKDLEISNAPEPDTRYEVLLGTFKAMQQVDQYSPTAPTLIERRFNEGREIPEARVEQMFEQLLASPLRFEVGELIEQRLGRPLEPFDIWYNGFRQQGTYTQEELDALTRERYPTAAAYEADIPRLLVDLGFAEERAKEIAANIVVDPARGSGHAWGAAMRDAKSHLRTRVGADGMDYKGYNIAVHEMGHNVEQTLSLNEIDYYMLEGVPNTAFTEALAFVFQARDLELLGLGEPDALSRAYGVLNDFWGAAEISAVALVDMRVWHWMYENPEATAAELKEATLQISKDIWNEHFAEIFHQRDVVLLGIYSHMIHSFLYLPDYPIGHLIALQVEEQMEKAGDLGGEFERMAKMGNVTPDLWMMNATGAPVGSEALLAATRHALEKVREPAGP